MEQKGVMSRHSIMKCSRQKATICNDVRSKNTGGWRLRYDREMTLLVTN